MTDIVLKDKMRIALAELVKAQPLLLSAITELQTQGYTTEAANLSSVLTDLISGTEAAQAAVAAAG